MPKKDGVVLRPVKSWPARRMRITSGPRGLGLSDRPTHFRIEGGFEVTNLHLNVREYLPVEGMPGHYVIVGSRLVGGGPKSVAWGTYCPKTQTGELWAQSIADCYVPDRRW